LNFIKSIKNTTSSSTRADTQRILIPSVFIPYLEKGGGGTQPKNIAKPFLYGRALLFLPSLLSKLIDLPLFLASTSSISFWCVKKWKWEAAFVGYSYTQCVKENCVRNRDFQFFYCCAKWKNNNEEENVWKNLWALKMGKNIRSRIPNWWKKRRIRKNWVDLSGLKFLFVDYFRVLRIILKRCWIFFNFWESCWRFSLLRLLLMLWITNKLNLFIESLFKGNNWVF
jgi:hypothetical protein